MPVKSKTKKQTMIMVISLTAFSAVSLILILFERVKKNEQIAVAVNLSQKQKQVKGQAIKTSTDVSAYRENIVSATSVIGGLIKKLEDNQKLETWESASLNGSLLAMVVPPIYQKLHFKLVQISNHFNQENPDLFYLKEQTRLLKNQYSWLIFSN